MSIVPYNATAWDWTPFARRALSYAGRSLRGYRRPTGAGPTINPIEYDARYEALRRAINRNAPAVENVIIGKTITHAANATTTTNWCITDDLVADTNFALKYIGDKFRLHSLKLRIRFSEQVHLARVVVYWPKNPGDYLSTIDAQSVIDPTQYVVLFDTMLMPYHGNQQRKQMLIKTVNLKKRIVSLDRTGATAGTVKTGELRVTVWADNVTNTAGTTYAYYQPFFSNK